MGEGLHQRASAVEQLAQNGFFFFNCKFETYVNVISNRNSCCKSDSSNFCCMILGFVKCNCPCTKCSYLIMNCFNLTVNGKEMFGLLCDTAGVVSQSCCVWTWGWDRESSSHRARCSCAHGSEDFQNLTKLSIQGAWKTVFWRGIGLLMRPFLLTCL